MGPRHLTLIVFPIGTIFFSLFSLLPAYSHPQSPGTGRPRQDKHRRVTLYLFVRTDHRLTFYENPLGRRKESDPLGNKRGIRVQEAYALEPDDNLEDAIVLSVTEPDRVARIFLVGVTHPPRKH